MVRHLLAACLLAGVTFASLAQVAEHLPTSPAYKGEIRRNPDGQLIVVEPGKPLPHAGQPIKPATLIVGPQERIRTLTEAALPLGERPTLAQAASMIDAAIEAADRYYPAFRFLTKGMKKPEDALAACLFETVGSA